MKKVIISISLSFLLSHPVFAESGGGTGVGGTSKHSSVNYEWCHNSLDTLKRSYESAKIRFRAKDFLVSFERLEDGIIQTIASAKKEEAPLIHLKMLHYALDLSAKMKLFLKEERNQEFVAGKMFMIYDQLLLPTLKQTDPAFQIRLMNQAIFNFAGSLYRLNESENLYIPLSLEKMVLEIIKISSFSIAKNDDLDLNRAAFSCEYNELKQLGNEVESYLMNNHPDYTLKDMSKGAFDTFVRRFEEIRLSFDSLCK